MSITPYFKNAADEWSHMSYEKRILFLRKLRYDFIHRGKNGNSWFVGGWQQFAETDEFDSLPEDLKESMFSGFKKFGCLQSFEL